MMKEKLTICAACLIAASASWGDGSDQKGSDAFGVLRLIPAELPFAAVVVDFEKLDRTIASFVKRLDVDTQDVSVLADVKSDLEIGDWIDFTKPFALAAVPLGPTAEAKAFWARVPDFRDKAKSLPGATEQEGVWHLPFSPSNEIYARPVGEYVIAATTRSALEQITKGGESLADELRPRAHLIHGRDVILHVNMNRMRDRALGGLAQSAQMVPLVAMMAAQRGGADPAIMTAVFSGVVDAGKKFLEQVTYIDITFKMDAKTADLTLATGYREGPIKKHLATQQPAGLPPLTEIEEQPYFMAMGYHLPGPASPFTDYVIDQVLRTLESSPSTDPNAPAPAPAPSVDPAQARDAARYARELYRAFEGMDLVMAVSPDGLKLTADYISSDPNTILRLMKDALTGANPLLARIKGGTSYEALGSKKIGEITVDEFILKQDPTKPTNRFYGPEARFALGVVGRRLRACKGSDPDMQRAFRAKISRPLSSSTYVRAALSALPDRRNAIILIDPAGALPILGPMLGKPDPMELPPGPPIAISASLCDEPARLDIHVPLRAIERIVQAMSPQDPT